MTSDNDIGEVMKLYGHYAPPKEPYPKSPHSNAVSNQAPAPPDRRHGDSTPHNQYLDAVLNEFAGTNESECATIALRNAIRLMQDPDIHAALLGKKARRYVEKDPVTGKQIPHKEYRLVTENDDDPLAASKALKGFVGNSKRHYYDDVREILRATQREIETQIENGSLNASDPKVTKLHGYCSVALMTLQQALDQSKGLGTP